MMVGDPANQLARVFSIVDETEESLKNLAAGLSKTALLLELQVKAVTRGVFVISRGVFDSPGIPAIGIQGQLNIATVIDT